MNTMNTLTTTLAKIAAAAVLMIGLAVTPSKAGFFSNLKPMLTGAPSVTATVSISEQRMTLKVVDRDGFAQTFVWKVSTGKTGFETPTGAYKPTWLSIDHRSKTYDNAPMPFAVFFTGGYAIHATDAVARLGKPASHGCVRLAKDNAAMFFQLVEAYGKWKTKIVVTQ
jgi:lipoprotein-anchoring transpeptidase ErfK/SrfK